MPQVPRAIIDAGGIAIVVFLIAVIVLTILKIIQAVKSKPGSEANGKRLPCIQSPQLQAIMTNQAITMEAVQKIEAGGEEIKQNMVLQTKLMEQFGQILSKLSDCMVRQEATQKAREETRAWPKRT